MITEQTTVGEVAGSIPGSIPLFQEYQIDFCCGGGRTVSEVCREKGISFDQFLKRVTEAGESQRDSRLSEDWTAAPLSELIAHIVGRHHAYLNSELPRLAAMLAKVVGVHGSRHPESLLPLQTIYGKMKDELEQHMWKEENILFPMIEQMEAAKVEGKIVEAIPVRGPIQVMEMEHESAGHALREIRRLTSDFQAPQDGCATYRALFEGLKAFEADMHQHIHLENNILFPRAAKLQSE